MNPIRTFVIGRQYTIGLSKVATVVAAFIVTALVISSGAEAQSSNTEEPILSVDAVLTTPVYGLQTTHGSAEVVEVNGPTFGKALKVSIALPSSETNATQLCMPISAPVSKGDVLMASLYIRGQSADGSSPAQATFLFEKCIAPWTNSTTHGITGSKVLTAWKRYYIPFQSAETYAPGEAMVSLRFAFGPQTVEVGGLSVVDYGTSQTLEQVVETAAGDTPLGRVDVAVHLSDERQTLIGFGGDYCQARYGDTQMLDPVGSYTLNHLHVVQARIGVPLNDWEPEKGQYRDDAQSHAAFLLMQEMARRQIPVIATVWEGPGWLLPGKPEQSGRTLAPAEYADCIDAIGQFLVTARDKYGAEPEYFSFNEPDWGVNFLFTPSEMGDFIRQAGPRFKSLGLRTKFLTGDTTGGMPIVNYAAPLLQDKSIAAYLGPISFHCWDSLSAPDDAYAAIAKLGTTYHKAIFCTEAGHDAGLWQSPDPWGTWENALRTALAYTKTLRLTGASTMDYWTYANNYPLVSADGKQPYAVFNVIKQMQDAVAGGSRVVASSSSSEDLSLVATAGPGRGQFSIIVVNPVGAGDVLLSGLPPNKSVWLKASSTKNWNSPNARKAHVDGAGRLLLPIDTRSVVTVVSI